MNQSRRTVLKGLAASPLVASKLAQHRATADLLPSRASDMPEVARYGHRPDVYTNFAQWLADGGLAFIKDRAKDIQGVDPDLLSRRLPLATIVRLQQERNLKRLLADRENWFTRTIRKHGSMEWMF